MSMGFWMGKYLLIQSSWKYQQQALIVEANFLFKRLQRIAFSNDFKLQSLTLFNGNLNKINASTKALRKLEAWKLNWEALVRISKFKVSLLTTKKTTKTLTRPESYRTWNEDRENMTRHYVRAYGACGFDTPQSTKNKIRKVLQMLRPHVNLRWKRVFSFRSLFRNFNRFSWRVSADYNHGKNLVSLKSVWISRNCSEFLVLNHSDKLKVGMSFYSNNLMNDRVSASK